MNLANLRRRMAAFGFESNDDYSYRIRCLFGYPTSALRCLSLSGESSRRQTAFANALAQALEYPHTLYHDFSQDEPPAPAPVAEPDESADQRDEPLSTFDRCVIEACAYSEAEPSILILDQLHSADFREQIKLYQFIESRHWFHGQSQFKANRDNLLIVVISQQPLYHSLQKVSFKIWTDAEYGRLSYLPQEFDLGAEVMPLFASLADIFDQLGVCPTRSEFEKILFFIQHDVRTESQLCDVIYGWTEGLDRRDLDSAALKPLLRQAISAICDFIGVDQINL